MKKKIIVDILMFIFMILEFSRGYFNTLYHEIFGVVLLFLMLIHLYLNRNYFKNIFKGRYSIERVVMLVINLLLVVTFVFSITFGILSSEDLFSVFNLRNMNIVKFHKIFSYLSLIIVGLHLGINLNTLLVKLKSKIKNNMALDIVGILIVLYGGYSFYKLDLIKHILGIYHFSLFDGNIFINSIRYISIVLGIAVIVYKLNRKGKRL